MKRTGILESARVEYDAALADSTFVCPYDAARNAAFNYITAEVWRSLRITSPIESVGRDDARNTILSIWAEFEGRTAV